MGIFVIVSMLFTYYSATVKIVLDDSWEENVKKDCFTSDWDDIQSQSNIVQVNISLVVMLALILSNS